MAGRHGAHLDEWVDKTRNNLRVEKNKAKFEQLSNLELPWFSLLRYVIGAENSRHFLDQSDLKLKPIAIWSPAFSRASSRLL